MRKYVRVPDGNHCQDGSLSRGKPVGLVLGQADPSGRITLGYSRCSPVDSFDPQLADQVAFKRMQSGEFYYDPSEDVYSGELTRDMYGAFNDMIDEIEWVIQEILDHPDRNCRMPKYAEKL